MPGGDLEAALSGGAQPPLSAAQRAQVARDCAEALAALHAARIAHRDVKPRNVLLTTSCRAVRACPLHSFSLPGDGSILHYLLVSVTYRVVTASSTSRYWRCVLTRACGSLTTQRRSSLISVTPGPSQPPLPPLQSLHPPLLAVRWLPGRMGTSTQRTGRRGSSLPPLTCTVSGCAAVLR